MRKVYLGILKSFFYSNVGKTRVTLNITQTEMSERLAMDSRSYIELEHGNSCCSALTLALFLIYCCTDPIDFLNGLRAAFEAESNAA